MRELIAHLRKSGDFETTVLSPREGPLRRDLEEAGAVVKVEPIPFDRITAYEEQLTKLAAWADGRFDVTLGFTLTCFAAVDLAERLGLPSLYRIGDCETLATVVEWLGGRLDPEVELRADRAFASASMVLFNSEEALRFFRERGHLGRFVVRTSGTDVEGAANYRREHDKESCRRRLGIAPERRLLLNAATLWPVKGQALLVSALAQVYLDHPNLECVLVGQQNNRYVDSLARHIERLGLTAVVRLLPFTEDLQAWRCAADVAVSASEHESMSGSILEAMAFGLPVLSSRAGGSAEVVEEGVTGWLCEANDLGSLVEKLRCVAEAGSDELRALAEQAMRRVRLAHDSRVAYTRIADLIRQLAREKRPRQLGQQNPVLRGAPDPWDAGHSIGSAVLFANHLLIVGSAPEDDHATAIEISDLPAPIAARVQCSCQLEAGRNGLVSWGAAAAPSSIAACALDFESAKLLAETTAPVDVGLQFASGATCRRTLRITSFKDGHFGAYSQGIAALCDSISKESPDLAQILRSVSDGEHLSPSVSCRLRQHLIAPACGFVATGQAEGIESRPVVFLLDDMKLVINPDQIFLNLSSVSGKEKNGGHVFTCIETVEGVRHEMRLAVLGEARVQWSDVLTLTNTGSARSVLRAVGELLSDRELSQMVATGDILFQLARQYSQPQAASVTVANFTRSDETPDVSIIVPFYAEDFFLLDHIGSQRRTDARAEWLFICDDPKLLPSMLDTCRARREEMRKPTRLLSTSENVGFAAANNIAFRHAAGEYIVFMNSDIYWRSFAPIEYGMHLLQRDKDAGVVGFTLHYEDGALQHDGMRVKVAPELNNMLITVHEGKGLPSSRHGTELAAREVEAVTGALMVVRRRDFTDEVFNEDYVGGDYEDGDLCLEMRARGKKVMLVECDGLYHLERQSIRRDAAHRLLTFVNRARFSQKWSAYVQARQ